MVAALLCMPNEQSQMHAKRLRLRCEQMLLVTRKVFVSRQDFPFQLRQTSKWELGGLKNSPDGRNPSPKQVLRRNTEYLPLGKFECQVRLAAMFRAIRGVCEIFESLWVDDEKSLMPDDKRHRRSTPCQTYWSYKRLYQSRIFALGWSWWFGYNHRRSPISPSQ